MTDRSVDGSVAPEGPGEGRPAVSRLLTAGAKGAERVAHVTGVDHALNQAVEEAIVRALRSPAVVRAIERAIEEHATTAEQSSDEVALAAKRVLRSDAAAHVWAEVLESEQAQMLVERVARAPEVRSAIASQGAGLITDVGIRLTKLTEQLDDRLERIARPRDHESETNQAGLATRAVAAAVDLGLLFIGYSLLSGVLASLSATVFGGHPSVTGIVVLSALGVVVGGGIFAAFWALAGQTPGMRFLSIRLIQRGSTHVPFRSAVLRVFGVILSLLPLGLGYLAILRNRSRRAWHDRLTGTEVIYDRAVRVAPHSGSADATVTERDPAEGRGPQTARPRSETPAQPIERRPRGARR